MSKLLFSPSELLSEIGALSELAAKFLDPAGFQLKQLATDIRGLIAQQSGSTVLEIPESWPLRTRISKGDYETSGKSNREVFAEITGIWKIELSKRGLTSGRRNRKVRPKPLIGYSGLASMTITVYDQTASENRIAHSQMDVGDLNAPGCFFHTHSFIDSSFPVPRHPNLFPTPMSAIEFVLGELFQTSWERAVSGSTDPPQRWRSIQQKRLKAILAWQMERVGQATASPWIAIKTMNPPPDIFV